MSRIILFLLISVFSEELFAQYTNQVHELGQMSIGVNADGTLFTEGNRAQSSLKNGDAHFIRFAGTWALGVNKGIYHASINTADSKENWPGPIDTVTHIAKDPLDWNAIYSVTRSQVQYHIENYSNSDYVVPTSISEWPAAHNQDHIWAYMAAFVDWNDNGIYDPVHGDYPDFNGDRVVYTISNDQYGEHLRSGTEKLVLEQLTELYSYDQEGFEQIVFGTTYCINRSSNDYAPFYFGHQVDFQLGDSSDNRIRTDVGRNLLFGYNGDANDGGSNSFGTALPFSGIVYLNQPVSSSISFVNGDSVRGYPSKPEEIEAVMKGLWKNGEQKSMSGNGTGTGSATNFIYPGSTDPDNQGSSWVDEDSGDGPGKRNSLVNFKIDRLEAGAYTKLDFAFVFDTSSTAGFETIEELSDRAINKYRTLTSAGELGKIGIVEIYPNPLKVRGLLNVGGGVEALSIYDLSGKEILHRRNFEIIADKKMISCNELIEAGVYIVEMKSKSRVYRKKLIVTNE